MDGVYSADPMQNPDARRYSSLNYQQVLDQQLRVMDTTAFTLCQENAMPIVVLNFWNPEDLVRALQGDASVGTLISG